AQLLIDRPGAIVAAHAAFRAAGAEVVMTASYQLSAESLRRAGQPPDHEPFLLHRSVELARHAVGATAVVAGSLGPWGAALGAARSTSAATASRWMTSCASTPRVSRPCWMPGWTRWPSRPCRPLTNCAPSRRSSRA